MVSQSEVEEIIREMTNVWKRNRFSKEQQVARATDGRSE